MNSNLGRDYVDYVGDAILKHQEGKKQMHQTKQDNTEGNYHQVMHPNAWVSFHGIKS